MRSILIRHSSHLQGQSVDKAIVGTLSQISVVGQNSIEPWFSSLQLPPGRKSATGGLEKQMLEAS
jgi:hypothetical protein